MKCNGLHWMFGTFGRRSIRTHSTNNKQIKTSVMESDKSDKVRKHNPSKL